MTQKDWEAVDECEKHIRNLEAFGSLSMDQICKPSFLLKLPQDLESVCIGKNGNKAWEFSSLSHYLKDEIIATELRERHFGERDPEKRVQQRTPQN